MPVAERPTDDRAEGARADETDDPDRDDDPSVSQAIARDLRRRYGPEYRIVRAEAGAQALEVLAELACGTAPSR